MPKDSVHSKQLVQAVLGGTAAPRPATGPLAVHYCARLAGVSLRAYTLNPAVLAECVIRYYEQFSPDAVWVSADTWVTAQAMGASVAFAGEDQPLGGTGQPLVQQPADLERIPPPDAGSQGRWPVMVEALQRIRQGLGREVFVVACFDQYPFSLACALMGLEKVMLRVREDRSMLLALLEKCAEYTLAYGRALAGLGADMLSGGDSPAGLLGPKHYRELAWPYERRVIAGLKGTCGLPVSLHICGDATPMLADMANSGADVLELDHKVDIGRACRMLGPKLAIWGNLDPVGLLAQGTPEQVRRATRQLVQAMGAHGHRRFVLSSGCTLALETPPENLSAMLDTGRELSV